MTSNIRNNVKNVVMTSKKFVMMSKTPHDIKFIMMSKTHHDPKRLVMTSHIRRAVNST